MISRIPWGLLLVVAWAIVLRAARWIGVAIALLFTVAALQFIGLLGYTLLYMGGVVLGCIFMIVALLGYLTLGGIIATIILKKMRQRRAIH